MSADMTRVLLQTLLRDLSNATDNLMRAKLQKEANLTWKSGNGQTIDEVIAGYQERVDELEKAREFLVNPGTHWPQGEPT